MPRERIVISIVMAAAAAACDRPRSPVAPDGPSEPAEARAPALGLDGDFARLARQVPGFGGYYYDESGTLNLVLTDAGRADDARRAVAGVLATRLGAPPSAAAVRVRQGEYGFDQLAEWHARVVPLLALPGVVSTDADEVANRLRVGVTGDAAAARVRGELRRLGVPAAAVVIDQTEAVEPAVSLSAYYRPTVGGLGISPDFGGICTLGFNAYYVNPAWGLGPGSRTFATAAHCTATQGAVDGTVFTQGTQRVGVEVADPPMIVGGIQCPSGFTCRNSDVAMVRYDDSVSWNLGGIAHTTSVGGQSSGSTNADPANPFHIVGGTPTPVVGDTLHKVGNTTGWTKGPVVSTCVNYSPGNSTIIFCSDIVEARADNGDSGSPVFSRSSGSNDVYLAGVVWAKSTRFDRLTLTTIYRFVFSNMSQIGHDFGSMTTF